METTDQINFLVLLSKRYGKAPKRKIWAAAHILNPLIFQIGLSNEKVRKNRNTMIENFPSMRSRTNQIFLE
jgi:hypothetical protein